MTVSVGLQKLIAHQECTWQTALIRSVISKHTSKTAFVQRVRDHLPTTPEEQSQVLSSLLEGFKGTYNSLQSTLTPQSSTQEKQGVAEKQARIVRRLLKLFRDLHAHSSHKKGINDIDLRSFRQQLREFLIPKFFELQDSAAEETTKKQLYNKMCSTFIFVSSDMHSINLPVFRAMYHLKRGHIPEFFNQVQDVYTKHRANPQKARKAFEKMRDANLFPKDLLDKAAHLFPADGSETSETSDSENEMALVNTIFNRAKKAAEAYFVKELAKLPELAKPSPKYEKPPGFDEVLEEQEPTSSTDSQVEDMAKQIEDLRNQLLKQQAELQKHIQESEARLLDKIDREVHKLDSKFTHEIEKFKGKSEDLSRRMATQEARSEHIASRMDQLDATQQAYVKEIEDRLKAADVPEDSNLSLNYDGVELYFDEETTPASDAFKDFMNETVKALFVMMQAEMMAGFVEVSGRFASQATGKAKVAEDILKYFPTGMLGIDIDPLVTLSQDLVQYYTDRKAQAKSFKSALEVGAITAIPRIANHRINQVLNDQTALSYLFFLYQNHEGSHERTPQNFAKILLDTMSKPVVETELKDESDAGQRTVGDSDFDNSVIQQIGFVDISWHSMPRALREQQYEQPAESFVRFQARQAEVSA